jgi:DNA-binding response OmpR family regulator
MPSAKRKILIVEDDNNIRDMLDEYLTDEGYEIYTADSGTKALFLFTQNEYALALIDLMLPGLSGFEVIKEIRKSSTLPIIILTAKDSDADKTRGFSIGADDYVQKPFSLVELVARIKANIRRSEMYAPTAVKSLQMGELCFYPSEKRATVNKNEMNLTRTEFGILFELARNINRAIPKEDLYSRVWKQPYYGDDNVLNTHINRLRTKLAKAGAVQTQICTIWGIGYKLESPS